MTARRAAHLFQRVRADNDADADLLHRFAAGRDAAAFAALVRRHGPLVFGVCRRALGRVHDAEDAFQAVFLVLAQKAGQLRDTRLLSAWLYGVAWRIAKKAKRRAARRREEPQAVLPEPATADTPMSDLGPVLDEELAALPAAYRDAILACDVGGLSRADAAAQLGVPEGTLSSRLAAGRKKLADRLARRGVTLAVVATMATAGVSDALVQQAVETVTLWAAGGVVPKPVAELTHGGFKMVRSVVLLATSLLAAGAVGVGLADDPVKPPPKPDARPAEVKADAKPAEGVRYGVPKMRKSAEVHVNKIESLSWTPDGKWIAIEGSGVFQRLRAATSGTDKVEKTSLRQESGIFFYPADLSQTEPETVLAGPLRDAQSSGRQGMSSRQQGNRSLKLSADGRTALLFAGSSGKINSSLQAGLVPIFDKNNRPIVPQPANKDYPDPVVMTVLEPEFGEVLGYTPDGKSLATLSRGDGDKWEDVKVVLRDAKTGDVRETILEAPTTTGVRLSGDDLQYVVRWIGTRTSVDAIQVAVRGPKPVRWTAKPPADMKPGQVLFSRDYRRVYVAYHWNRTEENAAKPDDAQDRRDPSFARSGGRKRFRPGCALIGYETATGGEVSRMTYGETPQGRIDLSADGRLLASQFSDSGSYLAILDTTDGTVVKKWPLEANGTRSSVFFAFSPTEPKLIVAEPVADDVPNPNRATSLGVWEFPTAK